MTIGLIVQENISLFQCFPWFNYGKLQPLKLLSKGNEKINFDDIHKDPLTPWLK